MTRAVPVLLLVAAAMLAASPFMIDAAPPEVTMGLVQKIFYVHLPSAMLFMVSSIMCGAGSASPQLGRSSPRSRRRLDTYPRGGSDSPVCNAALQPSGSAGRGWVVAGAPSDEKNLLPLYFHIRTLYHQRFV